MERRTDHRKAFDVPLEVTSVDGEVVITGPDGLCASLTLKAAITSARRLLAAAGEGCSQDIYQKPLG